MERINQDAENYTGRSRGLTTKIHAVVDGNGIPLRLALTGGQQPNSLIATELMSGPRIKDMFLADKGYDSEEIKTFASERGAWVKIPPKIIGKTRSASARFFTTSAIILAFHQPDQAMSSYSHPV